MIHTGGGTAPIPTPDAGTQAVQHGQVVFHIVAEGAGLLVARLGLGDVDLLRLGCLGQGLQVRLGLKALAEMTVCVQGTQQRRQPHNL